MSHSLKSTFVRKAAKTGAKHTARGATSKLKREPVRAGTLLAIGCTAGYLAGRLTGSSASQA